MVQALFVSSSIGLLISCVVFFFFQAEDGIRYLVRSRGLGDVYKRQVLVHAPVSVIRTVLALVLMAAVATYVWRTAPTGTCLLYTSDAADERSSVDLGGRRIIKKKKDHDVQYQRNARHTQTQHTDACKYAEKYTQQKRQTP